MPLGDLSWGTEIKERLNCKMFGWFLENVYPELFIPGDPKFVVATGSLRNPATNVCLDTLGRESDDSKLGAYSCHNLMKKGSSQMFVVTKEDEVRLATGTYHSCFDRANKPDGIYIWGCHLGHGNQEWKWDKESGHLYDPSTRRCATLVTHGNDRYDVAMASCKDGDETMRWEIKQMAGVV